MSAQFKIDRFITEVCNYRGKKIQTLKTKATIRVGLFQQ